MEKSWIFITGLSQQRKINAMKWLEWQKYYIQMTLLSEQVIKKVFVNILLLEDSTASYYTVYSFCIIICILPQYNFS